MHQLRLPIALFAVLGVISAPAPAGHGQSARTIVVVDFETFGGDTAPHLGQVTAELVRVHLSRTPRFRVVERRRLKAILEEQKLNLSDLMDAAEAARVGRLLGAEQILCGTLSRVPPYYILTAKVIDAQTAEYEMAVTENAGNADGIERAARRMAARLGLGELDAVDKKLKPLEREWVLDPEILDELQHAEEARRSADFADAVRHLRYVRESMVGADRDPAQIDLLLEDVERDARAYRKEFHRLLEQLDREVRRFAGGGDLHDWVRALEDARRRYLRLLSRVNVAYGTGPWDQVLQMFRDLLDDHDRLMAGGRVAEADRMLERLRGGTGPVRDAIVEMQQDLRAEM